MRKANPDTDQVIRSLLQKAVRRGDENQTKRAIAYLIKMGDFQWVRKRLAVMVFEECWPYTQTVSFENDESVILRHYLQLQGFVKNKDAAGLGSLGFALSTGDDLADIGREHRREVQIIARAIERPVDFWRWVREQAKSQAQIELVSNAEAGFRKAGWPWDRAFAQATAYLAVTDTIPQVNTSKKAEVTKFPFWVGIDKHTSQGRKAIKEAAKQLGVHANKALWLAFYFESASCNELEASPWWDMEVRWRMSKLGFSLQEGRQIWGRLKPTVELLLRAETQNLTKKLDSISGSAEFQESPLQMGMF